MWPVLTAHVRFLLSFGSPACFFMQFIIIFSPGFLVELLQRPGYVAFLLWALVLLLKQLQKICSGLNLRNLLSYVIWFCASVRFACFPLLQFIILFRLDSLWNFYRDVKWSLSLCSFPVRSCCPLSQAIAKPVLQAASSLVCLGGCNLSGEA